MSEHAMTTIKQIRGDSSSAERAVNLPHREVASDESRSPLHTSERVLRIGHGELCQRIGAAEALGKLSTQLGDRWLFLDDELSALRAALASAPLLDYGAVRAAIERVRQRIDDAATTQPRIAAAIPLFDVLLAAIERHLDMPMSARSAAAWLQALEQPS
jgi:hypothetical protein